MKRILISLVAAGMATMVWGQTVADLTLIGDNGVLISFYDSPAAVLDRLGIEGEFTIPGPQGRDFYNDEISIATIRLPLPDNKTLTYELYRIDVTDGFETIRGIGVGSTVEDVIRAYPEVTFFVPGLIAVWEYRRDAEIPGDLVGYVYWNFGTRRRVAQWNRPIEYGFRFFFDEDGVVTMVRMDYIVTEK